jgi:hypothetical protein
MQPTHALRLVSLLFSLTSTHSFGQKSLADLLAEPGADLSDPVSRAQIVGQLKKTSAERRANARTKASAKGLPLRITRPNGAFQEIIDFEGEIPIYFTTTNANAAISTGASPVRTTHSLDGSGVTVGVWDGGSARITHQEFGARATSLDGGAIIDHATHVSGTIGAAGVVSTAQGMAPFAKIDSYDWNNDVSEMTARAATAPGQADKLYLSNHSYNFVTGWNYVNNGTRVWEWYGNGTATTSIEQDYGRYHSSTRDYDTLAYNAPYYLIFRSAGNDRTDNPTNGQLVALTPGSSSVVGFDSTTHPTGDGQYRGGFETIGFVALSKNIVTIGSASDAVTSGSRDPSKANVSSFSSWGPTDDGRIKPDLVANGEAVYSPLAGSNTAYGSYWGTSMATPNATGSTALLIEHYANLFSNGALRSSTMKGLLIQTADDRGNAGPDYRYGWGLVDAKEAADLISDHKIYPERQLITEAQLTTTITTHSQSFVWDGNSPIRATLCWTDPAGTATSTSDLRSPRLVNNLDLKIIAPGGSEYQPYVMPFVGSWTEASMNTPATTGINNTDNVEQVLLSIPPSAGTYQVMVSFSGNLTNNSQNFAVILSGASSNTPPPPPLSIASVSPNTGLQGAITMDLAGTRFLSGTNVSLSRSGYPSITATSVQLIGEQLRCQFDLSLAAPGVWGVTATNPDNETDTLASSFTVSGALWSESFDGSFVGWTTSATTGSSFWSLTNTQSHTPSQAYFIPAPASKTTTSLTSPAIPIASNASDLQLKFWHNYSLQSRQDGGRLEFSIDGGAWFDVNAGGSGAAFASNEYNASIRSGGKPSGRSQFAGLQAWTGNSGGFIETIVNLNDTVKYAGTSLQLRWTMATNSITSGTGWYVDSISLVGGGDLTNQAPVITSAAESSSGETVTDPDSTIFEIIRGASTSLTVTASDDGSDSNLAYAWSVSKGSPVFFSPNSTNAAQSTNVDFEAVGDYELMVSIRDPEGLTVTSMVNVRVLETASDIALTPAIASITYGMTEEFTASMLDQFGNAMTIQPTSFTWNTSGGGTIDSNGLFNATAAGGPFVIAATDSTFSGTSSITVTQATATITLGNLAQDWNDTPRILSIITDPTGLATTATYEGSPTPPTDVGIYTVEVNISDSNFQGSNSGQLVITGPIYNNWQGTEFTADQISAGDAAPTADADKDGLSNLVEYALGTDPNTATISPSTTLVGGFLTLTFDRPIGLSDVTYQAQLTHSLALNGWSPLTIEVMSQTSTTETVRARPTISQDTNSLFIRLRIDLK